MKKQSSVKTSTTNDRFHPISTFFLFTFFCHRIRRIFAKIVQNTEKLLRTATFEFEAVQKHQVFPLRIPNVQKHAKWPIVLISKNAESKYLLAKIGFDTAENEPSKIWQSKSARAGSRSDTFRVLAERDGATLGALA